MIINLIKILCLTILLQYSLLSPMANVAAEQVRVEATGQYVIGDGPDENIATAKERARMEAMRLAAEQGRTFVESLTEVVNSTLTKDEIRVITAQIMQIDKEDIQPIVDGKYITYVCHIIATIDTDAINIDDYISNKRALEENVKLQAEINRLKAENIDLKSRYQHAASPEEKNEIARQVKNNELNFKKAVVEIPVAENKYFTTTIDASSINFDRANGIITFKTRDLGAMMDDISTVKVDINKNSIQYLDHTTKYLVDGRVSYRKYDDSSPRPICGIYAGTKEVLKVYQYLGIEPPNMYKNPNWNLIYVSSSGTHYYIDIANSRYDAGRALSSFPIKRYNKNGLYQFLGKIKHTDETLFYYDYTYGRVGYWGGDGNGINYTDPFLFNEDIIAMCKEAKNICLSMGRRTSIWEE